MDDIDVDFCFYDEPEYRNDADRDSLLLRRWHQRLWSKPLPDGTAMDWVAGPDDYLTFVTPHGPVRVSSDTIATAHANYRSHGTTELWSQLGPQGQKGYLRAFYRIGGFIIFPVRPQSLNQRRGTNPWVADRFDLTLACIRQHYLGVGGSPLAEVLHVDKDFFRLFGEGAAGFASYVDFFHLQELVSGDHIRWLDGFEGVEWDFGTRPLPQTLAAYRNYLDNVADFVSARNSRIQAWQETRGR